MKRQENNKLTKKEKIRIRKYLTRKIIKHFGSLLMVAGVIFVLLASGTEEISLIIKFGVFGCTAMWLGLLIFSAVDMYETSLKERAMERRKRRRAHLQQNNSFKNNENYYYYYK